jgi:hypothetical protein
MLKLPLLTIYAAESNWFLPPNAMFTARLKFSIKLSEPPTFLKN